MIIRHNPKYTMVPDDGGVTVYCGGVFAHRVRNEWPGRDRTKSNNAVAMFAALNIRNGHNVI